MKFIFNPSKEYITEMALNRQEIYSSIYQASETIREHLMKIYLFNNETNNHWINEIHGALHSIARCKSNNKFLSPEDILDKLLYSWEEQYEEQLSNYITDIEYKEGKSIDNSFDKNDLLKFIEDYCFWLAERLSKFGFVHSGEVKDEINSLLSSRKI